MKASDRKGIRICFGVSMGCVVLVVIIIVVIVVAATTCGGDSTSSQPTQDPEDRRKGFHCLSQWDGNHDGLEALVRDQLNDPSSMDTYETRIEPVGTNNRHRIVMEFGAKNLFGAMVRHTATGWVDHDSCEATLTGIE